MVPRRTLVPIMGVACFFMKEIQLTEFTVYKNGGEEASKEGLTEYVIKVLRTITETHPHIARLALTQLKRYQKTGYFNQTMLEEILCSSEYPNEGVFTRRSDAVEFSLILDLGISGEAFGEDGLVNLT